eukprot:scaffold32392_cov52-Attheya_sp.AAC.2
MPGIQSQPSHRPKSGSCSSLGSDFEFGSFSSTSRFNEQLIMEDYFGSERPRENAIHPLLSDAQGSNFVPPRRRLGAGSAITASTSPEIRALALDLPFTPPFHRLCQGTPGSEVSLGSVSPKTKNGSISSSPSSSDSSSARMSRTSMSTLLSSLDSYGIGRSNEESFQARHKKPTAMDINLFDSATSVMGSILEEAMSTAAIQGKLNKAGEGSGLRKCLPSSSSSTRRNTPIVLPPVKLKSETTQHDKMNPKADSTNIHCKYSKITKGKGDPCSSYKPNSSNLTRNKGIVGRDSFGNSRNAIVKKKEVFPSYRTNSFESPSLGNLDHLTGTKKSKRIQGRSVVKPASSSSFKVHNDRSLPQTKSKPPLKRNKAQNRRSFQKKVIVNNHDSTLPKAGNKPLIPLRERNRNMSLSTPIEN